MHANPLSPRLCRGKSVYGTIVAVLCLVGSVSPTFACPFCTRTETLSDQIFKIDAAVVVRRISGVEGKGANPGSTTVRVERVLHISVALAKRQVDGSVTPSKSEFSPPVEGEEIVVRRYYPPQADALYLLRGADPEQFVWGNKLVEISAEVIEYVLAAPPVDAPSAKRGGYFLRFLEAEHPQIAQDAFAEFAMMPYADVAQFRDRLPREKIRRWIFDKQIPGARLGLYGLMLGLCGEKSDAALLEKKIRQRSSDFRLGIDGVMGGYLLLTGDAGMDVLETEILKNQDVPNGDLLAAMQAMRFQWTYGEGKVGRGRLKSAMRLLIDRPRVVDMAIRDLARWRDWSDMDRVVSLYGKPGYDDLAVRVGIVKYVLAAVKDQAPKGEPQQREFKDAARKHLAALREKDPKIVRRAERFFHLR